MAMEYPDRTIKELKSLFDKQKILRSRRIRRYDPGDEIRLEITGVFPARPGRALFRIDSFAGGGFAGQVYMAELLDLETAEGPIEGLEAGRSYAVKILIPPSGFARLFRNFIYALAFQGPFSPRINPDAACAGALWQKFLRRGAGQYLDSEQAVADILATFIDPVLGGCGEISEWIEGRLWRFEVDDNLDGRLKWEPGKPDKDLGSPEFRAKKAFMSRLVALMHDMGAHELARQYEWGTWKSQPNVLKRTASDPDPETGHVAIDFRAGLALLPFLPMSPVDFKLILRGIARGSLVQFDRGDIDRLQNFVEANAPVFSDMKPALEELKERDKAYRESLPDVSHNHVRLLTRPRIRSKIVKSRIRAWKIRNIIDDAAVRKLSGNKGLACFFCLLVIIPFLGPFILKLWGNNQYRRHYRQCISRTGYFRRVGRARIAEALIRWHRSGRIDAERKKTLIRHPVRFFFHLPLAVLPARVHRFFSDRRFFLKSLDNIFIRPFRLYFKTDVREAWLREFISQGEKNGMLTPQESSRIRNQIKEPFIQKYLKNLAVHVCTLPVTQIVSVIVAVIYIRMHPELSWQEASVHAGLILGLFQVTPISPGSLVRGLYVTFLVLKERNFSDYSIAFYLSFFKYIGYLAFPIQMAYRYPDLARFMAGHWATGAVHIVPVFGERGALLEHKMFDLFYNYPLTLRRRLRERKRLRAGLKPRYWHIPLWGISGVVLLALADGLFFKMKGFIPEFRDIWWAAVWIPMAAAAGVAIGAKGASLTKRILAGAACGAAIGVLHPVAHGIFVQASGPGGQILFTLSFLGKTASSAIWKVFIFAVLSLLTALAVEVRPLKTQRPGA